MRTTILLLAFALHAAPGEYSIVEKHGRYWVADPSGRISFHVLSSCTEIRLPVNLDPFAAGFPRIDVKAEPICWTPPDDTASWVAAIRGARSESEGKQMYVAFLKELYGYNIGRVNEAYGLEASAFTDLAESGLRTLDLRRTAVVKDDGEFGRLLATQTAGMIRRQIPRSVLFVIRSDRHDLAPYATALIVEQSVTEWPRIPILVRVRQPDNALADRIMRQPFVIGVEGPQSFADLLKSRLPDPASR